MIKGIRPGLAECGKIKIGGKGAERKSAKGGTYRLPEKYDHFLVTTTKRDNKGDFIKDESLMDSLIKDPDGKIRQIPIILHSNEIDEIFPTCFASYEGRKISCRGDGEQAITANGRVIDCNVLECETFKKRQCKPHGILHCSIALPDHAVAGAVYKWRTTSIISIQRLIGSLQQIKAVCGVLRGIPLMLKLEEVTVTPDGVKGSSKVYCCHVELHASDIMEVQRQALEAANMRRLVGSDDPESYRALISAPAFDETIEEQEDVADEFFPGQVSEFKLDSVLYMIKSSETLEQLRMAAEYAKTAKLGLTERDKAGKTYTKQLKKLGAQEVPEDKDENNE